jgi:hypothetical protein
MGYDVFISHSTKDKDAADAVCAALESSGMRCWIAPRDIKPGEVWATSILHGINQSRLMVLVLSPHANKSKHVGREVERADTRGTPILTLRIADVMPQDALEYFLSDSQWLDALTSPLQQHLPVFVQLVQASLATTAGSAAPSATTQQEAREKWAQFVDSIQTPPMSDVLAPALTAARDRFRNAAHGNEADVSSELTQLAERLNALDQAILAQIQDLGPALADSASAKRVDLLQRAVEAVRTAPTPSAFSDQSCSTLQAQFGEWARWSNVLQSARRAFYNSQLDTALAKLNEFDESEGDADLRQQADDLRDQIRKAKNAQSQLRTAIQAAIDDKRWLEAWNTVDALDEQTGRKETRLREDIVDGMVSAAEAAGDSGTWKNAIDLLTQFGCLGDGGAASLRRSIVAGLVRAAGSKADGDLTARQEALNLLTQLDRVSKGNVKAADLRRLIEGKGFYEEAAAALKKGAFQEAVGNYQKASERFYLGAAERLTVARVLAAADALLTSGKASVEQLEPVLKSLAPTPAFNPDEQAQASALAKRTQAVLTSKRSEWAQRIDAIPAPALADVLLPAWTAARDRFRDAVSGNESDVRSKLDRLAECLNAFDQAILARCKGLSPAIAGAAAGKRTELLQKAVDAVKASPSAEFSGQLCSNLETRFSEWVNANNVLEAARGAFAHHQLEKALAKLDDFNESDANLRKQAEDLREAIRKQQTAQSQLRNAIQAAIDEKRWLEAWNAVDALDQQTGRKAPHLRDEIVDGLVSTAETVGDSTAWKDAIDLLTRFGRLGDADKGAASLQRTIVADLLKAAGSKADGDATARQEALNLLNQLERVAKENAKAADLRRLIEGKGFYENAAARMKEGAFQEAAANYQKASERSYPGAAERLGAARVLAAADALLKSNKAAVEQLEATLKTLAPTPAFNPDEQTHAVKLIQAIQSVLALKRSKWGQFVSGIPAPALSDALLPAWTDARNRFANAVGGNEADVGTRLNELGKRLAAFERELDAQSQRLSPALAGAVAAERKALLQQAADAVRASPSAAEFPEQARSELELRFREWVGASNLLESARSAFARNQLDAALASLDDPGLGSDADIRKQAQDLRAQIEKAQKAQKAYSDLQIAIQVAIDGKRWAEAWNAVDALDKQTGRQETHLRQTIVDGVVKTAAAVGDSGLWKEAIDLLTRFGRFTDADKGAAPLQRTIAAELLKSAGSKADGNAAARQEALNLLTQLDRVAKGNAKAADLRRLIEGNGFYENAAARMKEGAFQEAATNYQKASERSYPGAAERLGVARVLAAADGLLKNNAAVEQLEPALKTLAPTPAFNADEQAQAAALSKTIQSVLAQKRSKWGQFVSGLAAPPLSDDLLPAWTAARNRFGSAADGNETDVRTRLDELGKRLEAFARELDAQSQGLSPALAGPAATKRKELLQQTVDAVKASPSGTEFTEQARSALDLRFREWVRASNVLETARGAFARNQLDAALKALDDPRGLGSDAAIRQQADELRAQIKKTQQAHSDLQTAIQAAIDGKRWSDAWNTVDALDKQTGRKETVLREKIVDGLVGAAAAKADSGSWKAAIELLTQFGRLSAGGTVPLQERIVAELLKAAGSKATGDSAARREVLNLLSQLERVAKGNVKAAELRRQIEGRNYYEDAQARVKAGAFQDAVDHYRKANERSCPGAAERLQIAQMLAATDALLKNDKAGVEQLELALKNLAPTPAFNADEKAQATESIKKVRAALAGRYFGLGDRQEQANPPDFAAAANHYAKSAEYGRPEAAARQKAAQQLVALRKLKPATALKKIADILPTLNGAEQSFAVSLRTQLTATLEEERRPREAAKPVAVQAVEPLEAARTASVEAAGLLEIAAPVSVETPEPSETRQPRRVSRWVLVGAPAAVVVVGAAGVIGYLNHQHSSALADNRDKPPVAQVNPAPVTPSQPAKPEFVSSQQRPFVSVPPATNPAAVPATAQVDPTRLWVQRLDAIQTPSLSAELVPAWTASFNQFHNTPSVDAADKLTQFGLRLKNFDHALSDQCQGLSAAMAGLAAVKRKAVLQQAADAANASALPAESPDDALCSKLETKFSAWVSAQKTLETVNGELTLHHDDAALAKLNDPTLQVDDPDVHQRAAELRSMITSDMITTKGAGVEKIINDALGKGDIATADAQFNLLQQQNPSYPGLASLQQAISSAQGAALTRAEASWQQKDGAKALTALKPLLDLPHPPPAALDLRNKVLNAQDVADARALLSKPDTEGASKKVDEVLDRDPQNLEASTLADQIFNADLQQGNLDGALASYKVLANHHPLDPARQKRVAELDGAKKLVDDARTQIKGQKWQAAVKDLTDLAAKPGFAGKANLLWPDLENGLLTDATTKADAASWKVAIDLFKAQGRFDPLKQKIAEGLLSGADKDMAAHKDAEIEGLLTLVDQVAPNNSRAASIRAYEAEQNGDFDTAATYYTKAGMTQQAKEASQLAAAAAAVEHNAQMTLEQCDPAGALKILAEADPRIRKALAGLMRKINDLHADAQKNYDLGVEALNVKHNPFDAYGHFFDSACGGSAEAMLQLGDMKHNGPGTMKVDESAAKTWWQRAAALGSEAAKDRLTPAKPKPVYEKKPGVS